jgi:DNA repair exonuclease SbcCD ATPase subunit
MVTADFDKLWEKFHEDKATRLSLKTDLAQHEKSFEYHSVRKEKATKAREIFILVGQQTQDKLTVHISKLVTTALLSVFPEEYGFKVDMVTRRNQSECDLLVTKEGREMSPMDSSGGGVVDVIAFALRIAFWSLRKSRPVFLLDETFKNVSSNLHVQCSEMMSMLSEKLGIQIILVSHLPGIISAADRIFHVESGNVEVLCNVAEDTV